MKKSLIVVLVIIVLIISIIAYADDMVTYTVDELNMSIDLPAEWITLTLDTDDVDPNFALLGVTADELKTDFATRHIYLNSIQMEPVVEIVVTMVEYDISQDVFTFNQYSDSELDSLAIEMIDILEEETGADYYATGTYNTNQAKFATFDLEQDYNGLTIYGHQFYTIINGQAINVTMHSYEGPLTAEMRNLQNEIVEGINFDPIFDMPERGGIDWDSVAFSGVLGGILAGSVFLVAMLIAKRKKKKKADSNFDF